jgi:hypothetical protein
MVGDMLIRIRVAGLVELFGNGYLVSVAGKPVFDVVYFVVLSHHKEAFMIATDLSMIVVVRFFIGKLDPEGKDVLLAEYYVIKLSIGGFVDIFHSLGELAHHNCDQKVHHNESEKETRQEEESPIVFIHCGLVEGSKHCQILSLKDRQEYIGKVFRQRVVSLESLSCILGTSETHEHDERDYGKGESPPDTV